MEKDNKPRKKILLVDDESSIRRTVSLGLNQEGYDVEPCETGVNALKKLEIYKKNNITVDQIILDIQLTDVNGIKLAKIIKSKYPEIPIVFISGYEENFESEDLKDMEGTICLAKPFTTTDLTEKLTSLENKTLKQVDVEDKSASVSSYALIKFEQDIDFVATYEKLYSMENVLYCDAAKGDYDIFLLIQGPTRKDCKVTLKKIADSCKGIEKIDFLEVERPILDSSLMDIIASVESMNTDKNIISENNRNLSKNVSSYVMLEVEREKMENIYPHLRLDEQVIYCDYVTGKFNLVLLVKGHQFSDIDKFVENKVATLDGVIKVKEYPIISLFDM